MCLLLNALSVYGGQADCDLGSDQLSTAKKVQIRTVYDGDTVELADGRKVRLIGINTPEVERKANRQKGFKGTSAEPGAGDAKAFLDRWQRRSILLLVGKQRKDRYGRILGHIFDGNGRNLTAEMLSKGLGFLVTVPPNDGFSNCYAFSAAEAAKNSLGVWGLPYHRTRTTTMPRDLKGGFGRFRGKIERIYVNSKVIWIDLIGDISLRVSRKDQSYLEGEVLERILTAVDEKRVLMLPHIDFSGWLMDRTQWGKKSQQQVESGKRKRWQMNIRHRNHWALSS